MGMGEEKKGHWQKKRKRHQDGEKRRDVDRENRAKG